MRRYSRGGHAGVRYPAPAGIRDQGRAPLTRQKDSHKLAGSTSTLSINCVTGKLVGRLLVEGIFLMLLINEASIVTVCFASV